MILASLEKNIFLVADIGNTCNYLVKYLELCRFVLLKGQQSPVIFLYLDDIDKLTITKILFANEHFV